MSSATANFVKPLNTYNTKFVKYNNKFVKHNMHNILNATRECLTEHITIFISSATTNLLNTYNTIFVKHDNKFVKHNTIF